MKTALCVLVVCATCLWSAPTVSDVHARIESITDNGQGLKTRSFVVHFDLANTNGNTCRVFPGVRAIDRNPVLENEGPYLWYTGVAGDTAVGPGTGYRLTFTVVDTAGEFDSVRVKVTAWDREDWPPWPNRPFNPRHHGWALDVRNCTVSSKSTGFIGALDADPSPAFMRVLFDFPVFRVMGDHPKGAPDIVGYPGESDDVPVPFAHTSYGDPADAYPEGNASTGDCDNDGDCHIEVVDVDNWESYSMFHCVRNGTGPFDWDVSSQAFFPLHAEAYTHTGTGPVPGESGSPVANYRPITWTSADAAGLAILPGLVLLDEVAEGEIHHALRSVTYGSANYFVYPASHRAGARTGEFDQPMGLRWRLKDSFDINAELPLTGTPGTDEYRDRWAARIILRACQKYGVINADNSGWSNGYLMAEVDDHLQTKWDDVCGTNSVTRFMQSTGLSWDDFEIVDWEWQYDQYAHYEALK